jgi:hypothetical protein
MSKTGYMIFRPDGTSERGEVDWPHEPGYDRLKRMIEPIVGGPLEHVAVLHNGKRADMFVDEMGHVYATGPKPFNEAATKIYRANWMKQHPGQDPEDLPTIAGIAVLFDRIVWM